LSTSRVRRPGVVTFIGAILYIQAFMAATVAIVSLAFKGRLDGVTVNGVTLSSNGVVATAGIEAVLAVILFIVAAGLMRGSRGYRLFVAVVEGLRMASALVLMIFHSGGAYVDSGLATLLIGTFVLWALYGHEKSEEYFESTGG
jgi:hypothetical protein